MSVAVVFHIVLAYALIHGLARKIVQVVLPPLETKIIEQAKPPVPDKPPPPPPPKLEAPPPPFIPPPEVKIQTPVQPPPAITVAPTPPPPAPVVIAPTPPPAPAVQPTRAQLFQESCPRPPYPAAWRRAGEAGTVRLRLSIDPNGRVVDSRVERSSGFRRLDEAAREAGLACKFKPATGADGRPAPAEVPLDYTWRITD